MRISRVSLKNFKRFTDLTIRDIPDTTKLVVLIGPNGCGKSSIFDAFLQWYRAVSGVTAHVDDVYYRKDLQQQLNLSQTVQVNLHGASKPSKGCLYFRTAYRNVPDFSVAGVSRPTIPTDEWRFTRFIENDAAVSANYQRLLYETTTAIYDPTNDLRTVQSLREEMVGQVRASMRCVFDDLVLNHISDPFTAGTFFFEKGTTKSFHYKNLSGGEKAAFDLLLDVHIKKKYFPEAIYCIDELETHLHTSVQGALLREIVNILPEEAQLWVTTHSLGVLRAAQEMEASSPGSTSVIDFEAVDADLPTELSPATLGRVVWEKLLSVTLDDLSQRVAPKTVVVCEGSSVGTRRKDFDADIYDRIFAPHYSDVLFVSGGSSLQIANTGISVREVLSRILPRTKVIALADRDDKSSREVAEWESNGGIVLAERNLECYLLAEETVEALLKSQGKQGLSAQALQVRADALSNSVSRNNPPDDLKSAAGEIYTKLKSLLSLSRQGNSTEAFLRDSMAPLIKPGMDVYRRLKACVIDKI